ncbi:MAG: PA14 domain-containing protein [Fimbriimonadaceae bacterium]
MLSALLVASLGVAQIKVGPLPAPGLAAEAAAPFSWYLVPSDELGFKDCPQAFQMTFDGAINNGYGELDLAAGVPLQPVDQRVKTLYKGYLPIVEYGFDRDGAHYAVEAFAAPHNLDPRDDLVAFERVTISNPGRTRIRASLRAAFNPRGSIARSDLKCRRWYQDKFFDQPQPAHGQFGPVENIPPSGSHSMGHLMHNRNAELFYSGAPAVDMVGAAVTYEFPLGPGESRSVELAVPFVPIGASHPEIVQEVAVASFGDYLSRITAFWEGIYRRALQIDVPDPKVVNTMRSSLTYDLMARDIEADGTHFTQTVNKFQYHGFFARDTSFIARSYELLNLPDIARGTIEKYLVRDGEGKVTRFLRTSPDDWGQSLWAIGSYFRSTGDLDFANEVHPAIAPHLDEFEKLTGADPMGLWPVAGPYDNELINGHYTSHNLWALLGLNEAENLCRAVHDDATADRARKLYARLDDAFMKRLSVLTALDEGYIPPGMDDPNLGYDWENASGGVYPFHVLPPDDPWVTATVNMERAYKYREGIMTWGPNAWVGKQASAKGTPFDPLYLHDYDTFQVDETLLARGDQRAVIEDLYSTLVHTSSTNAGFETSIRPWGDRDPGGNYPPHGWFAARYNELLRNMLLREVGDELDVASALAPTWVAPGNHVSVVNGTTSFGMLNFDIRADRGGVDVNFDAHWRDAPAQIRFHIPWFVRVTSASADGSPALVSNGVVDVSPTCRRLNLRWRWASHPDLTYDRAVKLWLHKAYSPMPGEDMDHLFPTPTPPGLADPETLFANAYDLRLVARSPRGKVHFTLDDSPATGSSPLYSRPVRITQTTTVRAIEVWPDGRESDPLVVRIRKAEYVPAIQALTTPGLAFRYYDGKFDSMPNFAALTPIASGTAAVASLDAVHHRQEVFALELTGFIRVAKDGIYSFWTGSDDGSKMWIGDDLVVDNDGPHPYAEAKGQIALRAGLHPVRITYFDAGGANSLKVFWAGPRLARHEVPNSAWFQPQR